jgi:Protein of unknown function (DUF2281)
MSTTFSYNKIDQLPEHLRNEVNDFVDFLLLKERKKKKIVNKENSITRFSGILTDEEADEISNIIKDCRKIDLNEW